MEEEYIKLPLFKVIDLILVEERQKIRKFYLDKLGKATADMMDSYVVEDNEMLKMLKK